MNRTAMKMKLLTLAALLVGGSARAETFQNLEAVDTNGFSTWAGSYPAHGNGRHSKRSR